MRSKKRCGALCARMLHSKALAKSTGLTAAQRHHSQGHRGTSAKSPSTAISAMRTFRWRLFRDGTRQFGGASITSATVRTRTAASCTHRLTALGAEMVAKGAARLSARTSPAGSPPWTRPDGRRDRRIASRLSRTFSRRSSWRGRRCPRRPFPGRRSRAAEAPVSRQPASARLVRPCGPARSSHSSAVATIMSQIVRALAQIPAFREFCAWCPR